VRDLLDHLPKASREKSTWQHVAAEFRQAAASADAVDVSVALQMVQMLERVEYHPIENKNARRTRGSAG